MIKSPSPTPEEIADRKLFLYLVEGMDLPKARVLTHDYHWIGRYAGVRNSNHPNFESLMEFIKLKTS
jgi:hypothetical protein